MDSGRENAEKRREVTRNRNIMMGKCYDFYVFHTKSGKAPESRHGRESTLEHHNF